MSNGMIFDIKRYAINDGPGIRTAVFLKGCPLECWWCHNPEGQSTQPQLMVRLNRCKTSHACQNACPEDAIRWEGRTVTDWERCDQCGKCAEVCYAGAREMVGRQVSIAELMAEIMRDVPFFDQSGGGVTFTGGEPLAQPEFLVEALKHCKEHHIHAAVDTCGHTSWENFQAILPLTDLFLYDLKLVDEARHMRYTGVTNRLLLGNLRRLSETGANILVRIPLIPGINNDVTSINHFANFLSSLPRLEGVALMPYHTIGVAKYEALGMSYKLGDIQVPTKDQISQIEEVFLTYKLPVIRHTGRAV
ncbi:MAG: glycyl-radical enzyme activating protein [Anaerolineales bacterium]|nr:MAG: glycyl-radical enzyme activating protein [Anaerolineales bacterium]